METEKPGEQPQKKKRGFGGIFIALKNAITTDEYKLAHGRDDVNKQEVNEQTPSSIASMPPAPASTGGVLTAGNAIMPPKVIVPNPPAEEVAKKIYAALEKINQPGIDFFEVWNAAESMPGGLSASSLQAAYTALKFAPGSSLSVEMIIKTGETYCDQLKQMIDEDVSQKEKQKQRILDEHSQEKQNLLQQKENLEAQIRTLQSQLNQVNAQLEQFDISYAPRLEEIEANIIAGRQGLAIVLQKVNAVITLCKTALKD